jgi:putative ABC transport system substrate-binding protein
MNVVSSQWSVVSKAVLFFTVGAALLTLTPLVDAQTKKLPRMGLLWPEKPEDVTRQAMTEAFLRGLRDLGYEQGKNIAIEHRYAEGRIDLFAELAAELVGSKLDLKVTGGFEATRAAKNATKTIPSWWVSGPILLRRA